MPAIPPNPETVVRTPALCTALTLTVTAMTAACADESRSPVDPEVFTVPVFNGVGATAVENLRAHARGREEVPPVDTRAQGQAVFQVSDDGEELTYKLIVANIEDVLMAHIHQAPAGVNGPIVVWLYPSAPPPQLIPGRTQGVLAEGTITAGDLTGPLEGMDLDDLLADLRGGNAYVNVHTEANPPGEIRGQIH